MRVRSIPASTISRGHQLRMNWAKEKETTSKEKISKTLPRITNNIEGTA
jgi:hypothetical protein